MTRPARTWIEASPEVQLEAARVCMVRDLMTYEGCTQEQAEAFVADAFEWFEQKEQSK